MLRQEPKRMLMFGLVLGVLCGALGLHLAIAAKAQAQTTQEGSQTLDEKYKALASQYGEIRTVAVHFSVVGDECFILYASGKIERISRRHIPARRSNP